MLLNREETVFVLTDVQGKLAQIVDNSETVIENVEKIILGLIQLDVPIIWLEQNPQGLGSTVNKVSQHLSNQSPIPKMTFSACKNRDFKKQIEESGRKRVLIAGIEAHICVYQTAVELYELGYEVQVVEDAVSSRSAENKKIALKKMNAYGISSTSVEMMLYELLKEGNSEEFKKILNIIK